MTFYSVFSASLAAKFLSSDIEENKRVNESTQVIKKINSIITGYHAESFSVELDSIYRIKDLREEDLLEFFDYHDKLKKTGTSFSVLKDDSKSIDFIHFIWMGNPMKQLHKDTILSWKKAYPKKLIILWVDDKSLECKENSKFAKDNNIKLINLEEIFDDENTFGLNEFIKKEKDQLLFPNWGAISDMYRYLIMYYFAGTYSDCDSIKSEKEPDIDYEKELGFLAVTYEYWESPFFNNDRLISKNIRNPFWKSIFAKIVKRYKSTLVKKALTFNLCKCRVTLARTGPKMLGKVIKNYKLSNPEVEIADLEYKFYTDSSWLAELTDERAEKLLKEKDIEERIIKQIQKDLSEFSILHLERYEKIIEKLEDVARKRVLENILIEIDKFDDHSLCVDTILLPKNIEEYNKIIPLLERKAPIHQNLKYNVLQKAAIRQNLDIFKHVFNLSPKSLFYLRTIESDILKHILTFNDNDLILSILKYDKDIKKQMSVRSEHGIEAKLLSKLKSFLEKNKISFSQAYSVIKIIEPQK